MTSATCGSPGQPLEPRPRVLVVGAGFAGVAAAGALRKAGVEEVVVLEAQGSPGGRVQKIPLGKREREGGRGRGGGGRETDRQAYRQTDRQTGRQTDRQTEAETDR